ncbi:MAG: hypothetical protein ACYSVY_27475, partial [Planctomycetota bacterium]
MQNRFLFGLLALGISGLLLSGWLFLTPSAGDGKDWEVIRGDDFEVRHRGTAEFAVVTLDAAQRHYARIRAELGLERLIPEGDPRSWAWNRFEIRIHPSVKAYRAATPGAAPSAAFVVSAERRIETYDGAAPFLDTVLPQEIARRLYRDVVGMEDPAPPRWLEEGVAAYAERSKRDWRRKRMARWARKDRFFPFRTWDDVVPEKLDPEAKQLYRTQAATVVAFFLETLGAETFSRLLERLAE